MQPGTYTLKVVNSATHGYVMVQNTESHRAALLSQFTFADPSKETLKAGVPRLQFECASSRCILREMWQGASNSAYQFQGPKLGRGEDMHIAEIRLTPMKAD
jgi:hypothetical protein